jgi:hypothetical protein
MSSKVLFILCFSGLITSCATPLKGSKEVKFVDTNQLSTLQGKCEKKGRVKGTIGWGARLLDDTLRNNTVSAGGNVLLTEKRTNTDGSEYFYQGIAYNCPVEVVSKLIDSNSL